jgi:hypothetical protein
VSDEEAQGLAVPGLLFVNSLADESERILRKTVGERRPFGV